jgi:hypothetical protein
MLLIQHIRWQWTKLSRDALGGEIRATLPRAHPLSGVTGAFVLEQLDCPAAEGYRPRLTTRVEAHVPGHAGLLRITALPHGRYALGVSGDIPAGFPKRHPIERAVELAPGGCWRLVINARISSSAGQSYEEHTLNVTCGDEVAPDFFATRAPDKVLELRAHLF